jgi:hypothetical protein
LHGGLFSLICSEKSFPCSAELISIAYQPWNSVFLSQQISHSRLISQKNSLPNRAFVFSDEGVVIIFRFNSSDHPLQNIDHFSFILNQTSQTLMNLYKRYSTKIVFPIFSTFMCKHTTLFSPFLKAFYSNIAV